MIITIKVPSLHASIDTLGAQLISLKDKQEKEYIWQRNPEIWTRCSPILFPIVGNCRNNRTIFHGKHYSIPKHGFCKDMNFSVSDQTESSVTFCLSYNEETLSCYPYKFRLSITYTISEGILSILYQTENLQDKPMPFCLGAHPGFCCPVNNEECFEDYQLVFDQEEYTNSMVYDLSSLEFDPDKKGIFLKNTQILPLSYDLFQNDAIFFERIRSRKVSLIHKTTKRGVMVNYPDFESIAFWTSVHPKAPFLCIEPWNGSAIRKDEDDEFLNKHGIQILNSHQTAEYLLQIQIV